MKNNINLKIGLNAYLKMFLRGIDNLNFTKELQSKIAQAKINERVYVKRKNGDIIVAVRSSSSESEIISAYNLNRKDTDVKRIALYLIKTVSTMLLTGDSLLSKDVGEKIKSAV